MSIFNEDIFFHGFALNPIRHSKKKQFQTNAESSLHNLLQIPPASSTYVCVWGRGERVSNVSNTFCFRIAFAQTDPLVSKYRHYYYLPLPSLTIFIVAGSIVPVVDHT